jgi:outer membrane protein TolC
MTKPRVWACRLIRFAKRRRTRETVGRNGDGLPGRVATSVVERRMAAADEHIGIAQAAFYPTLSLSAVAGFAGAIPLNWLTWPSRMWAVANTVATVAGYRQSALTAFQEAEDNLAALHDL